MSKDEYLRWLIDRSDKLRGTIAASGGLLLTANAIILSGLSLVSRTIWEEISAALPIPLLFLGQLLVLGAAWIALIASVARALGAMAAANGFKLGDFPTRPTGAPLLPDGLPATPEEITAALTTQLTVANQYVTAARLSLHQAGFNLAVVPLLVLLSFAVRAIGT